MHILYDENGNLVPHGAQTEHEHAHTHTYEHTHAHSHEHSHEHGHDHEHDHHHDHEHHTHDHAHQHTHAHPHSESECTHCGACEEKNDNKLAALLDYMLKHNEHHAAELDQVAEKLIASGKPEAAAQIKKAVDEFSKGNLYLGLALSMVK